MTDASHGFMMRAIELAEENARSGGGGPFGCVIVKDGRIIAEGTNLVTATHDPTAHAEIVAIRAACDLLGSFQLTGCEIFASCEPCPMCLGAIYWARPARLFYAGDAVDAAAAGFDDELIREQLTAPVKNRSLATVRMMEEEGKRPFEIWKDSAKKDQY